jgi:catechol-2,3-dioxygenase
MSDRSIDPGVRIGHVHLNVADIDRALAFYCGVLGFQLMQRRGPDVAFISAGGYHHHIGLNTWESRGGSPPAPGTTGLYHLAVLYPTLAAVADALRRLIAAGVRSRARPITASAKRSICAIRTTTASSFIATGRAKSGRGLLMARSRCLPSRSI